MTRVVHLHLHARRTGVTRHVGSIVRALPAELGAAAFGFGLPAGLPRVGWRALWRSVRAEPLVLHAHRNLELLLALSLRAAGRAVKVVATRHSATPPSWLTRRLMARADLRIALTDEGAELLSLPARVVGHGVALERFEPPPDRAAAFRALGLPGRAGVGVVGRVRPAKGQADFVAAWAQVADAAPEWVPVLVGAVRPSQRAFAQSLRAELPSLVLAGEVDRVERWLAGLSIVVQPSRSEGFSLALLEAMASGACVVAAALPHYARGVVAEERTGFLYPPGDVEALRAILSRLVREPETVRRVGAEAAAHARRCFGIDTEARALDQLYRELMEVRR